MSMTLSGNGTITGLVSGGLPDGTVLPADLSTGGPYWDTSSNLQFNSGYGSVATAYGCRAWVNFNGTGTVAIRASGNVSSITDNGTGSYTVNFTTAMPDANYAACSIGPDTNGINGNNIQYHGPSTGITASSVRIANQVNNAIADAAYISLAIFR